MEIVKVLNKVYESKGTLNVQDKEIMSDMLRKISHDDATLLYQDCCKLYCSESINDCYFFTIEFDKKFINSLIEIGTFMDKLSDAITYNESERTRKWDEESKVYNKEIKEHKSQSTAQTRWSNYMYEMRDETKRSYESVLMNLDDVQEDWKIVLRESKENLSARGKLFFSNISTTKLTCEEKKALLYKFSQIYNVLPMSSRLMMNDLAVELYKESPSAAKNIKEDAEVTKMCCSIL
jgi:hypothetical protein